MSGEPEPGANHGTDQGQFRPDLHSANYRMSLAIALERSDAVMKTIAHTVRHAEKAREAIFQRDPMRWLIDAQAIEMKMLCDITKSQSLQLKILAFILDELLVAKGEPRAVELSPVKRDNGGPPP